MFESDYAFIISRKKTAKRVESAKVGSGTKFEFGVSKEDKSV